MIASRLDILAFWKNRCNVALKRLDTVGKTDLIQKIDIYILWGYPIFYLVGFIFLGLLFSL